MSFDVAGSFGTHFAEALAVMEAESSYPLDKWPTAGKMLPANQVKWWRANGPALCQKYIDWYEAHPDINVWLTPEGEPAIELDLTVNFGKVPVRVIIDQVLAAGTALIVVDLKSGSVTPETNMQLGIYASAIELKWPGLRPKYGTNFMHKQDPPFKTPKVLDGWQYSVPYLTDQFEMFDRAERSGAYVARPGKHCDRCSVADQCPALGIRPS